MNRESRDRLTALRAADDQLRARAWGSLARMSTGDVLTLIEELSDLQETPNSLTAALALIGFCELVQCRAELDRPGGLT